MRMWVRTSRRTGVSFRFPVLLAWLAVVWLAWPLALAGGVLWIIRSDLFTRPAKVVLLVFVVLFIGWAIGPK